MTDKFIRSTGNVKAPKDGQPIPMRLFAAWEVDRTPPNCVPRLCSLTLSRLVLLKPLPPEFSSVTLAVKMQSSKRTLRSNEIQLPAHGLLDTELELSFALQYPHYLKQDGNKLLVMLQWRKRYKNRTILGFKTLGMGAVNMAMALQKQMDIELELNSELKDKHGPIAKVTVQSLSSQPVDHEEAVERLKSLSLGDNTGAGLNHPLLYYLSRGRVTSMLPSSLGPLFNLERNGVVDFRYSDDEDEFTSNEDASDSEPMGHIHHDDHRTPPRHPQRPRLKQNRAKILPNARQRNLKQKFIALLKRFKITEDLQGLAREAGGIDRTKLTGADLEMDAGDIEDLIDELEDLSDSGPEMDTLSVTSTPKPSLRPFFASSRSLAPASVDSSVASSVAVALGQHKGLLERHYSDESSKRNADSDSLAEMWTDQEQSDPPPPTTSATSTYATSVSGFHPSTASATSSPFFVASPTRPFHEDKANKEMRRSRLFTRERAAAAVASLREKKPTAAAPTKERLAETSPRKILLEQLVRCMPADDLLPDHVILVSGSDLQGCNLAGRLVERQQRVICTGGAADVRATIGCLVGKIQKFCNCSAKPPPAIKVVLMGSDSYVNAVLRCYVEQFSSKPPDWQNHLRFYIVPFGCGPNALARYLASLDRYYNVNFVSDSWRESVALSDRTTSSDNKLVLGGESQSKMDIQEVIHRLGRYLTSNGCTVQVPIAEAMITYREPTSEEESTQVFIPFVSEVRIGIAEPLLCSIDTEDGQILASPMLTSLSSGSPPHQTPTSSSVAVSGFDKDKDKEKEGSGVGGVGSGSGGGGGGNSSALGAGTAAGSGGDGSGSTAAAPLDKEKEKAERIKTTPPGSPNISSIYANRDFAAAFTNVAESVELQVDYWLSSGGVAGSRGESGGAGAGAGAAAPPSTPMSLATTMAQAVGRREKPGSAESVKYTVKAGFRWIVVQRLPSSGADSSVFTMTFGLKEKKQKIMRLGKKKEKEKELEAKSQVVEGINRLVCQAKTHHSLLKVVIDGVEWNNVKFFQLSSQWQTHIRHLPVALFTESTI